MFTSIGGLKDFKGKVLFLLMNTVYTATRTKKSHIPQGWRTPGLKGRVLRVLDITLSQMITGLYRTSRHVEEVVI